MATHPVVCPCVECPQLSGGAAATRSADVCTMSFVSPLNFDRYSVCLVSACGGISADGHMRRRRSGLVAGASAGVCAVTRTVRCRLDIYFCHLSFEVAMSLHLQPTLIKVALRPPHLVGHISNQPRTSLSCLLQSALWARYHAGPRRGLCRGRWPGAEGGVSGCQTHRTRCASEGSPQASMRRPRNSDTEPPNLT